MAEAGELLSDVRPDLAVWAGTSGFWRGRAAELADMEMLARAVGCRAVSSRDAVVAALHGCARPVGVLTPYVSEIHSMVVNDLVREGVDVGGDTGLGESDNSAFAAIPASTLGREARILLERGCQTVAVVCTNLTLASGGLPVVDSAWATLWYAAHLVGAAPTTYWDLYEALVGQPGRGFSATAAQAPMGEVRSPR